jgi:hypothetical protein
VLQVRPILFHEVLKVSEFALFFFIPLVSSTRAPARVGIEVQRNHE